LGIDSLSLYNGVALKQARLPLLDSIPGSQFQKIDLADRASLEKIFDEFSNTAARATSNIWRLHLRVRCTGPTRKFRSRSKTM
jgi:hypothetical protein